MSKRYGLLSLVLVFMLVFAGVAMAMTASAPESVGGVTPYIIDGENPGGNRTCAEVGTAFFGDADYYESFSARVNYEDGTFDAAFPPGFSVTVTDGISVTWAYAMHSGLAVIVKGSAAANVYVYETQTKSDSGLAAPVNASTGSAGLSNLTFCWNPETEDEGQWCSPGYWRQEHHLGSWEATGYAPTDLFFDALGYYPELSNQGRRNNATTNPTLWQVLQSPQWYGGDAFNAVGDLLSESHPDVNFLGVRVENSCPLN
jgi:hypothetical protein